MDVTKRPPTKIEVQGVSHGFFHRESPVVALLNVELAIDEGEIVSVVGPSGCGKTTLLNAIAGFIRPTRGRVLVDGQEVTGPGPERGVVFQDYALFRWLSVQGNIEFGLKMRGVEAARRKELAEQHIRLVGLSGFKNRYPYELSGGMQQRVAIARVFANESTVLLMDEPFASLDAQTREIMQEELLRLWSKMTKTILFITHSVDEAIFIATRVVVMTSRPGRIKRILGAKLPGDRFNYHIRTSPEFNALKDEVLELVREETVKRVEDE